jgi:hypothetical protein
VLKYRLAQAKTTLKERKMGKNRELEVQTIFVAPTYHEKRDSEMFPARGFHGAQHGAHDGAANPHEGDHHNEPPERKLADTPFSEFKLSRPCGVSFNSGLGTAHRQDHNRLGGAFFRYPPFVVSFTLC